MKLLPIWFFCALGLLSFGTAHAETADSEQPIQIFSDKFDGDDVKQVAIYTGDVAVHQGTLEIHGNKLVLTVDPQGYRHAVMTPLKGKLVTFKQRRDQNPAADVDIVLFLRFSAALVKAERTGLGIVFKILAHLPVLLFLSRSRGALALKVDDLRLFTCLFVQHIERIELGF